GSAFAGAVHGPYQSGHRSGCGHFAFALDIEAFQPVDEFAARMEALIAEIKATPLAPGVEEIHYPGEVEANAAVANARDGLVFPAETLADLRRVAAETRIPLEIFR